MVFTRERRKRGMFGLGVDSWCAFSGVPLMGCPQWRDGGGVLPWRAPEGSPQWRAAMACPWWRALDGVPTVARWWGRVHGGVPLRGMPTVARCHGVT